ncbi:MAG: ATP-binding protein [Opitutaceae bacterium]
MNLNLPQPTFLETVARGGGGMGERIRAFDWSRHPLGPPEYWPQSLKTVVRIMLTSRYAMWLGWGPEFYFFHNDAYTPTLGIKQAWALGTPAAKLWAEIWNSVGPRAESVARTGNATWDESLRLFLERSGYTEETYHTFSCSPVSDDEGAIGGMLCVATEDTERVIGERRMALLHELASDLAGMSIEAGLFRALQARLAARDYDLPFALVYLFESGASARLACSHGVKDNPRFAPELISTKSASPIWPAGALLEARSSMVIDDLDLRFQTVPSGPWDKPPRQAVAVPIAQQGADSPAGFLVAGLNPYRPLDAAYIRFLELLAGQVAAGISNVRTYEAAQKRAEALAELDRAKTAFFGNVSHELRTPLTLMLAPIEELLKAPSVASSPELRDLAAIVHRNGLRLLKVVNSILDFSSVEAGRMQAAFEPVDLAHFTGELASAFRSPIERTGLKFVVDFPPLEEPVYVDCDMWEKIVLNLLSNAFKFTLTGEIGVSLATVGDRVELSVRDTGAGIPPEARPHLFERFFRVRAAQGRTHEGTGIGLTLVHELVKLHGGTLQVESEPGTGTRFTVSLRRGNAHLPTNHAPANRPGSTAVASFVGEASQWNSSAAASEDIVEDNDAFILTGDVGGRVLVVDDNADLRRYVARLLSARFEVLTAADGVAALEIIQKEKPDLVLTDAMMPNLDGFGLLKAIRSRPELRTIPVILLSARAGEESRIEGLDAGADDFLVKPFSGRELLARVNTHVQMARIRGQAEERERELRTRAEVFASALRESSERLSASLAAAGTGTFRWDLRTNMLDFDESLDRLLGLTPIRKPRTLSALLDLIHPDDRPRVRTACERCLREGVNFDLEYRITRPDGTIRWLEDKAETFFDEIGRPSYMTGACVDITKRKQAETFVWRQKDVLEQIVQGAPLPDVLETLTLDVEQVAERKLIAMVLMADPAGVRLTPVAGRRRPVGWMQAIDFFRIAETDGSCGAAAFRKERVIVPDVMTSPLWEKRRLEALKHGLRACWSTPILSSHGIVLGTFAIYHPEPATPTEDEIRFVDIVTRTAAIAVERDRFEVALRESQVQLAGHAHRLEERVHERTAELQETVSELESFSYSISHDMRAPLRAMQSFAQILSEECGEQIGPNGKDYIRRIIGASDRMDRLIQDVLTYSRVTRTELQLEPVDVTELLDGILETYPQFQNPRAQIEVRRPFPRVMANEAGLVQCLSNLIGNAIKFVAPGVTPHIEIWSETEGERVRLFVRDNGIGIEPQAHEKIFRIFYQLDRRYEGTGIGLSVVRKAAERMGGSVGLKSQLNRGSTFHLEFATAH